MKHGGLGITDPRLPAECAYNTSKSVIEVLVVSLLVVTNINYVVHKGCVRRASSDRQLLPDVGRFKGTMTYQRRR